MVNENTLDLFKQQFTSFEGIWKKDGEGVEFIYARDLQVALGYSKWDKFLNVIEKAKIACNNNGHIDKHHFLYVGKVVDHGGVAPQKLNDMKLTRYACYLTAQNGDPRKTQVAFAQNYFAVQTRKLELIIQRIDDIERLDSREKLKESEKEFSRIIYEKGIKDRDFGIIKSAGDKALFGIETKSMKNKLGTPDKRPLADFTHSIVNNAKTLANSITTLSVQRKDICGLNPIKMEHVASNTNVREALTKSGIKPEELPKQEDIKKIERKIKRDDKKLTKDRKTKNTKKLTSEKIIKKIQQDNLEFKDKPLTEEGLKRIIATPKKD